MNKIQIRINILNAALMLSTILVLLIGIRAIRTDAYFEIIAAMTTLTMLFISMKQIGKINDEVQENEQGRTIQRNKESPEEIIIPTTIKRE